jgi:hypothetical protein
MYLPYHPQTSLSNYHIRVCQVAKSDTANRDALVDLFTYIEIVLKRLKIHHEVTVTPGMTQILVKILLELVLVCAMATKEVTEGPLGGHTLPLKQMTS